MSLKASGKISIRILRVRQRCHHLHLFRSPGDWYPLIITSDGEKSTMPGAVFEHFNEEEKEEED